jgi:hypothetical protein
MRYIILLVVAGTFFSACKKDKYTTAPQISFVSVSPDFYRGGLIRDEDYPILTIHVTDAEGDLGLLPGDDSTFVHIKNIKTGVEDSVLFPYIKPIAVKNFDADVSVFLKLFLGAGGPVRDTLFFDVYVKDFANNKSNVLRTEKPVYYIP